MSTILDTIIAAKRLEVSSTTLPQMSIPIGMIDGCPVGLSFIGWAGGDEALLDLAVQLAPYCGITA